LRGQNIKYLDTLGLYVHIFEVGDTSKVKDSQTVRLSYIGKYLDGIVFDQTKDTTSIPLKINTSIAGLRGGLTMFGKNGSGTIYIPSTLGYGDSPPFGVRKNAILVYDVKILDVY
jgi:FKBP-type peptidyl-prolyl cis-trans isomerase FkpA